MSDFQSVSFPSAISRAVFYNKYSRFDHDKGRRETKPEAIGRAFDFLEQRFYNLGGVWSPAEKTLVESSMHALKAMCSMRLLWSAGPFLASNHVAAYNCSFMVMNRLKAFSEMLFILMSGTGAGYSVESEYVSQLPRIKKQKKSDSIETFVIADSTEGWCDALDAGIQAWWTGGDIQFDGSQCRPAGSVLKTKGGRSSGVQPLLNALAGIRRIILKGAGRNAKPIMVHDINCLIAQVVVVGGIRRSSLIALFDIDDMEMRAAKHGEYWRSTPARNMSNNSIAYNEEPDDEEFTRIWLDMVSGHSGEPGIFNRDAFRVGAPRRKRYADTGCNPCGEINLRNRQFCNLSSIVCRPDDNRESLIEKIQVATIIGTIQASLTDFPYITPEWRENCVEEALLGVSTTGQMDCSAVRDPDVLRAMRAEAIEVNLDFAKRININPSAAITTGKPEGTFSLFVDSGSGAHTRWSKFGIRRMQLNINDPMLKLFQVMGLRTEEYQGTPGTWIVDFPFKSPEGAITRHDLSAIQQLEHWLMVKETYTEHNQSITVYYKDTEIIEVLAWIKRHWKKIGGLAFLPSDDHVYPQAPFQEITKEEYEELMKTFPQFTDAEFATALATIESEDNTTGAQELACVGTTCEVM